MTISQTTSGHIVFHHAKKDSKKKDEPYRYDPILLLCPRYLRVTSPIAGKRARGCSLFLHNLTSFPFGGSTERSPEMRPVEVLLPERFTAKRLAPSAPQLSWSLPATIIRAYVHNFCQALHTRIRKTWAGSFAVAKIKALFLIHLYPTTPEID